MQDRSGPLASADEADEPRVEALKPPSKHAGCVPARILGDKHHGYIAPRGARKLPVGDAEIGHGRGADIRAVGVAEEQDGRV